MSKKVLKTKSRKKKPSVQKKTGTLKTGPTTKTIVKGEHGKQISTEQAVKDFEKLCDEKRFEEAETYLSSLKGLKKWQTLNLVSILEFKRGNLKKAEAGLREAHREPDSKFGVRKNLVALLVTQGRMREALPFAKQAYEECDTNLKIYQLYINCLLDLGMSKDALEVTAKGIKNFPDDKTLLVSRASALRSQMRNKEAEDEMDELIKRFPDEPVVHRIKADLLGDKSTLEALPFYKDALDLSIKARGKGDPAVMWNMSLHLLRARELRQGWECWEQGFHPVVGTMGRNLPKRINDMDRADHPDKAIDPDKWTIICSEQGIGDQVLFMHSMHETIKELGKVLFICEARMHPIIKRSFPNLVVGCAGLTYDWSTTNVKKNGYIPLGSIPRRHRDNLQSYHSNRKPFLIANKKLFEQYREKLKQLAGNRPIIGISWKGGYWNIQRKSKALDISNWLPILSKDALFVNLQYGDISNELKYLAEHNKKLLTFSKVNFKTNLDEWLSIAAACDGIISVSTALIHFAGAIGQKVAIVMPGKQGPWHLGLEDKESMAYKNVKIFRPQDDEDLNSVIQKVADLIIE